MAQQRLHSHEVLAAVRSEAARKSRAKRPAIRAAQWCTPATKQDVFACHSQCCCHNCSRGKCGGCCSCVWGNGLLAGWILDRQRGRPRHERVGGLERRLLCGNLACSPKRDGLAAVCHFAHAHEIGAVCIAHAHLCCDLCVQNLKKNYLCITPYCVSAPSGSALSWRAEYIGKQMQTAAARTWQCLPVDAMMRAGGRTAALSRHMHPLQRCRAQQFPAQHTCGEHRR
jgi:hypothetical protein